MLRKPSKRTRAFAAITLLPAIGLLAFLPGENRGPTRSGHDLTPTHPQRTMEALHRLSFVENRGQWEFPARFVARAGPMTAFLEDRGWVLTLEEPTLASNVPLAGPLPLLDELPAQTRRGVALRMRFENGCEAPRLLPRNRRPGPNHFFLGNDPQKWRRDVPGYASVRYAGVYPGIDVRLREGAKGLEYDFFLEPGADLSQVVVRVEGGRDLALGPDGALIIPTALGPVRQPPPDAWVRSPSGEREVECRFVLLGPDRFGLVAAWDGTHPLFVDPAIIWSTFVGEAQLDQGWSVAEDLTGMVTVTGGTASPKFPTTTGAYDATHNGNSDVFVCRLDRTGSTLLFSTFVGGSGVDLGRSVFLQMNRLITIAGYTASTNFPTTAGAFDQTHNGSNDCFVARLTPAGDALLWSSFLGGNGSDTVRTVRVQANGETTLMGVVGGVSNNTTFPTTVGAYDRTFNGSSQDAFATRFNAAGNKLVFSTFIGGSGVDYALASDLGPNGEVIMTGYASQNDYPTTKGAYDETWNGAFDAFVTSLDPTGSKLLFSTFLGATGNDIGYALAVDSKGVTTIAGETDGRGGFPVTPGAFQSAFKGSRDVFVARVDATGAKLVFSTLIGGTAFEGADGLALAPDGSTIVSGDTQSADYPVTPGAYATTLSGLRDVFVSHVGPSGGLLAYSTFLGGANHEWGYAVTRGTLGHVTVTGRTLSPKYPTTAGAYDTTHGGNYDALVTRLRLNPDGVRRFGRSTPACNGDVALYALADAKAGSTAFGFACWKAPPLSGGAYLFAGSNLSAPLKVLGIDLWLNPATILLMLPLVSDSGGKTSFKLPLPTGTTGLRFYNQVLWANTPTCGGAGTFSMSDGLEVNIQ